MVRDRRRSAGFAEDLRGDGRLDGMLQAADRVSDQILDAVQQRGLLRRHPLDLFFG
jgi:hypothetical protein